jgi:hypothetical protein
LRVPRQPRPKKHRSRCSIFLDEECRECGVDPKSAKIISWLSQAGGWGTGSMRFDFSIRVLQANASTPTLPFSPSPGFHYADPDLVASVPLPPGGGIERQTSYQCHADQEDCHFILVEEDQEKLYEAWAANYHGNDVSATELAIWDLSRVYPPSGQGDQCTSADAAGFPIAPLLFTADELAGLDQTCDSVHSAQREYPRWSLPAPGNSCRCSERSSLGSSLRRASGTGSVVRPEPAETSRPCCG